MAVRSCPSIKEPRPTRRHCQPPALPRLVGTKSCVADLWNDSRIVPLSPRRPRSIQGFLDLPVGSITSQQASVRPAPQIHASYLTMCTVNPRVPTMFVKCSVWEMIWGKYTSESESHPIVSDSLWLFSLWNSPGQNTGVDSLSLLQGIFPTQGSNPGLLHCRQWIHFI